MTMYALYVKSGKTMRTIAQECELSLSAISKVMNGKRRPSLKSAARLARSMGATVEAVVEAATGLSQGEYCRRQYKAGDITLKRGEMGERRMMRAMEVVEEKEAA